MSITDSPDTLSEAKLKPTCAHMKHCECNGDLLGVASECLRYGFTLEVSSLRLSSHPLGSTVEADMCTHASLANATATIALHECLHTQFSHKESRDAQVCIPKHLFVARSTHSKGKHEDPRPVLAHNFVNMTIIMFNIVIGKFASLRGSRCARAAQEALAKARTHGSFLPLLRHNS